MSGHLTTVCNWIYVITRKHISRNYPLPVITQKYFSAYPAEFPYHKKTFCWKYPCENPRTRSGFARVLSSWIDEKQLKNFSLFINSWKFSYDFVYCSQTLQNIFNFFNFPQFEFARTAIACSTTLFNFFKTFFVGNSDFESGQNPQNFDVELKCYEKFSDYLC